MEEQTDEYFSEDLRYMNTAVVRILIEFSSLEDLNCFSGALERCLLEGALLKEYWKVTGKSNYL